MKQNDSADNNNTKTPIPPEINTAEIDSALVVRLERLAFRLHDFANRLLGYLR